jgi:signal transduction histidine kinase
LTGNQPISSPDQTGTPRGVRLPPHWLAYLPVFVVLILAVLFLVLRARAEATTAAVHHSHRVITEVDRLIISLVSAESRQRGYILTGDARYLQPSLDAAGEVRAHLDTLVRLTQDDTAQQRRLGDLGRLIDAKLAELVTTLAVRDSSGLEAALEVVNTGLGQNLMVRIRAVVADLQVEEDRLLASRLALDTREQERAFFVIVLGSLLAAAVSYLISRQLEAAAEARAAQAKTRDLQNRRLGEQAEELRRQKARVEDAALKLEASNDELQRANEDLIRVSVEADVARQLAEEANQAKSQFLATMSHELRTPLNAIGGYAELVEMGVHGPITDGQRHALERIQVAQRHLLGLINDLLNYAKVEAGRVEYHLSDVRVTTVAEEVISLFAPQVSDRRLTSKCDDGADLIARADIERVQQILVNLLSNAVKFSDQGDAIFIECAADGEHVMIRVADTGKGIPADKLESIFDPFVQVHPNLTGDGAHGAGLGLAISRELAAGMGGTLTAESVLGEGSTFTLTLPRSDSPVPPRDR